MSTRMSPAPPCAQRVYYDVKGGHARQGRDTAAAAWGNDSRIAKSVE